MARQVLLVSDISGEPIDEKTAAKVRISFADGRRDVYEIDARPEELEELLSHARKLSRRGRRPKLIEA